MLMSGGLKRCLDEEEKSFGDRVEKVLDGLYGLIPLTLTAWAYREIPRRQFLLGWIFTTTTRAMLSAATGLGKTHIGMAFAFAMGAGKPFCHWCARGIARVLIVDGEMSRDLVKERLAEAEKRVGERPCAVYALCKEDAEHMPPLDTEKGQEWLDGLITFMGGIDFLILDNINSLTLGSMKEEDDWKPVIPWMQALTKRRIGVLWIHHTGHDKTRGYGTNTREWEMDTVLVAEKVDDPDADISMRLSFTKARQRRPETRADFEDVVLRLKDDAWTSDKVAPKPKQKQQDQALELLRQAIAEAGEMIPGLPADVRGVNTGLWKNYCETYDLSGSDNPASRDAAFARARKKLIERKTIRSKLRKVWIIQ